MRCVRVRVRLQLSNQRQIIVAGFGFTSLQTTLLGCVDGFIEIVTIWTGVTLVAHLRDARAYVGAIYFIPNIIGVFLINLLPWHNKIGLLFAQWTTGASLLFLRFWLNVGKLEYLIIDIGFCG